MAVTQPRPQAPIERLAHVGLTTPDAVGLCQFYERALGFRLLTAGRREEQNLAWASQGSAYRATLSLGGEMIELMQFERPGRPYPVTSSASDLSFQHFAIVVSDMARAYQRLCSVDGWSAISTDGPQTLPPSSGGVVAFKFRDPDGHPLELLAFPERETPVHWQARPKADLLLGIDHSAISVSDSARSIAFYQALGLRATSRSLNRGYEQARLDGLAEPRVEVTALSPRRPTPHVELLCYRSATHGGGGADLRYNDVAATRLVFETMRAADAAAVGEQALIDPDGHHLVIVESIENNIAGSADATPNIGAPRPSPKPETAT
jgi:catechol 2,3-dioxygenase-like lactoylglutathione lyase family enzyme